jgi:hypothetical protein
MFDLIPSKRGEERRDIKVLSTGLTRRVPAGEDPLSPNYHGKDVVKLKRVHCRTTAGCPPDDARAVFAPREMSFPFLTARIEKLDAVSGSRPCV